MRAALRWPDHLMFLRHKAGDQGLIEELRPVRPRLFLELPRVQHLLQRGQVVHPELSHPIPPWLSVAIGRIYCVALHVPPQPRQLAHDRAVDF